jgi:hypothetical protein
MCLHITPGGNHGTGHHFYFALTRRHLCLSRKLARRRHLHRRSVFTSQTAGLRPGLRADLVLAEGDPTKNILATRDIVAVWKRGIRIQRAPAGDAVWFFGR